jgi:hypothetical protein
VSHNCTYGEGLEEEVILEVILEVGIDARNGDLILVMFYRGARRGLVLVDSRYYKNRMGFII